LALDGGISHGAEPGAVAGAACGDDGGAYVLGAYQHVQTSRPWVLNSSAFGYSRIMVWYELWDAIGAVLKTE
jgi:hypothetical protein